MNQNRNLTVRVYITGTTILLGWLLAIAGGLSLIGLTGHWLCGAIDSCREYCLSEKAPLALVGGLIVTGGLFALLVPVRMFIRYLGEDFWWSISGARSETRNEIYRRRSRRDLSGLTGPTDY